MDLRAGTSTLALRLALSRHTGHYLKVDLDQTFANQNQQFPDQTGQDIKFVIFGGVGILEGLLVCRLFGSGTSCTTQTCARRAAWMASWMAPILTTAPAG